MLRYFLLGLFTSLVCSQTTITFPRGGSPPGIFPENFDFDPRTNQFLVGSVTYGAIFRVGLDGTTTAFAATNNGLNLAGVEVDLARNLVWGCVVNFTTIAPLFAGQAPAGGVFTSQLWSFNLTSGATVNSYMLAIGFTPHFVNDVAFDAAGNAYAVDSFGGKIWRVTTTGVVSTYVSDARFLPGQFGLDGIDSYNGYLVVMTSGVANNTLFKVSLTGTPPTVTPITLLLNSAGVIANSDGIIFNSRGELIVASNADRKAYLLRSTDDWVSASITATYSATSAPTYITPAVTLVNDTAYLLNSVFGAQPASYPIEAVVWVPVPVPAPPTQVTIQVVTQAVTRAVTPNIGRSVIPSIVLLFSFVVYLIM